MGQASGNHTHELSLTSRSGHAPAVQPSLRAVWWAGRSGAPTSLLDFGNWRIWQGRVLLSMAYSQPASCQLQRRIKWMFFSLCWRWCLFCLPIGGIQKCEGGRLGVVWSRGPSRAGREHLVWASWTKKTDKGHTWASWAGPGGLGIPWPLSEVRIKWPRFGTGTLGDPGRKGWSLLWRAWLPAQSRGRACQCPQQRDCRQAKTKSNESSDVMAND